jgi:glycosyltransferase involved in cell wall biosynthesis
MEADHLTRPFFSVVIPCFNDGALAIHAIRSCIQQKGALDLEILLVDDGSTDDSAARVMNAFSDAPCIRVLGKANGGLASARNHGLRNARGKWIVFLDSDDLLAPDYLTTAARACNLPGVAPDMVVLPFRYIDSKGDLGVRLLVNSLLLAPRFNGSLAWNRFWIRVGNTLPVSSIVISAALTDQLGGFDEGLKAHEDWDYWIRAIDSGARIRYARAGLDAATLVTLRQGMSSDRELMAHTRSDVRRRYCVNSVFQCLNRRWILYVILGVRTLLGMMEGCAGRRVNLTLP